MKIKEQINKQYEKEMELTDLSFQEWIDYFSKEPTSKELDDMEKHSKKVSNNPYYQPLRGA